MSAEREVIGPRGAMLNRREWALQRELSTAAQNGPLHNGIAEKLVFRQVAFPVSAFDWLKQCQRDYEARHGQHLNNNETLAAIMDEHRRLTVESEEHRNEPSPLQQHKTAVIKD